MARSISLNTKTSMLMLACLGVLMILFSISSRVLMYDDGRAAASDRQESNMRVAWDVLKSYGGEARLDGDRLMIGDTVLDGFFEPVDRIKALVGGTATIFRNDVRVTTNVTKPDGSRAVGTPLAAGAAYDAVLRTASPSGARPTSSALRSSPPTIRSRMSPARRSAFSMSASGSRNSWRPSIETS